MHPRRNPVLAVLLALAAGSPGCAAEPRTPADEIRDDVYHGHYEQAVRAASSLRAEHPGDPSLEALHRDASVAWLLEQGRRLTFQDHDLEALTLFRQARELEPDSAEVTSWIGKTTRKLSRTWLERGLELHASGKLAEAVEAYDKALEYAPGDPSALNGLGEATIQINYREGMGKQYFEEGIRSLSAYWLDQARSRFAYSDKYEPDSPKTKQRATQVDALLAQQRVTVAKGIEEQHRFGAARNEYRLAVKLDPQNAEAAAGFERCTNESKAAALLAEAKMDIVRMRLDNALALIAEGEPLTIAQKDLFEGARAAIEQTRLERIYQEALTLERDFQYEAAIERYGVLLAQTEYYKDAITRKDTLEEYVQLAGDLYAKAQSATNDADRLDDLRKIRVFWPEYKDVAAQLAALEPPSEAPAPKPAPPAVKKTEKPPPKAHDHGRARKP
ncbi:MAG TPA: tetratricopeptide repeat protein [Planctomycetota bacterium]|jgi:tetratricopeptide (TPR) repeat protein|nr:tetratricopeptide repeat protein [Planctomycetota bacterium]